MEDQSFDVLIQAVASGNLSEIAAERLLNAVTRARVGVPTGIPTSPVSEHHSTSGGNTHSH